MNKQDVINILEEIAVLLELSGENPFKSRAYQTAARNLEKNDMDMNDLVHQGKLFEIPGIGEAIGKKITELTQTGKLAYYEKLRVSINPGLLDMLKITGLSPQKINRLNRELGIQSVRELENACQEDRLIDLKGFGKKMQDAIFLSIQKIK